MRGAARFQFPKSKPISRSKANITQNVPGALPSITLSLQNLLFFSSL